LLGARLVEEKFGVPPETSSTQFYIPIDNSANNAFLVKKSCGSIELCPNIENADAGCHHE
jgi:hypothetical protein